jgi:hypothetical protein
VCRKSGGNSANASGVLQADEGEGDHPHMERMTLTKPGSVEFVELALRDWRDAPVRIFVKTVKSDVLSDRRLHESLHNHAHSFFFISANQRLSAASAFVDPMTRSPDDPIAR